MENRTERLRAAFAATIRAEVAAKGYNAKAFAKRAGIPNSTMGTYLNGTADIKMPAFYAIADALEIAPKDLWTLAEARMGDL
ncbi:hypothetical protein GCM10025865_00800 [Paraoerskovia sediminicola]|uniref:HTH cro/C1-type domain-containing protein n=1 Tax=Paraoerskovia sediminicola TaxID=1138587 RepID=A0ABN6X7U7_9CELL|nr:helix-turn-helix transcriptional regulator [Paraoerskovia sediminicola]BDZ40781.1 hypothetical protein GCM10025865_00800 [Paraoerskovia sediminicola]